MKETDPCCIYVRSGKWTEKLNLTFNSSVKSFSHLVPCYFLIQEKQPSGFHSLKVNKAKFPDTIKPTVSHAVKE